MPAGQALSKHQLLIMQELLGPMDCREARSLVRVALFGDIRRQYTSCICSSVQTLLGLVLVCIGSVEHGLTLQDVSPSSVAPNFPNEKPVPLPGGSPQHMISILACLEVF